MPKSQDAQKDVLVTDSRKSAGRGDEDHKHSETCRSNRVDFRIPGIPHSTVEQVERNRKETVRRSIEQLENHPNKNMLLKDYKKSEEISRFSRGSGDLIAGLGNKEIFEFYETSSKRQCPDCAAYWKLVSKTAHAENACSHRKEIDSCTKTDLTLCRSLDT